MEDDYKLKVLLDASLLNGVVVTTMGNHMRGVGKTTLLAKETRDREARGRRIYIIVNNRGQQEELRKRHEVVSLMLSEIDVIPSFSEVFVDGTFTAKELGDINKKHHIIGGFNHLK